MELRAEGKGRGSLFRVLMRRLRRRLRKVSLVVLVQLCFGASFAVIALSLEQSGPSDRLSGRGSIFRWVVAVEMFGPVGGHRLRKM